MSTKHKKKSKKTSFAHKTTNNQAIIQFSDIETGDKTTTDAEFLKKKPAPNKPPTPLKTGIIDDDLDLSLSMSDNDVDYGAEEAKDTSLKPTEQKMVTFGKFKEKQPISNDILSSKPQPPPPQQQQKSQTKKKPANHQPYPQKKKAGGEMKMRTFSTQDQAGSIAFVEHEQLKEALTDIGGKVSTQPSFYNDEKIHEIYTFLNDIVSYIKTNPFYIFAAAVATGCSKHESYFIRNTVQDLIKIITANGKLSSITDDYHKRFQSYSNALKNVNHILKSSTVSPLGITSTSTDTSDISAERSANITEAELVMRENLKRMRMVQDEMDTIKRIIINGNPFISSKFYYSQDLISLVNSVITDVQLLPNDEGIVSTRRYSPDKIIVLRPMTRAKLAEVCALTFSRYAMINGSRPTAKYLQTTSTLLLNENMLKLKEMLSTDDIVLEDEIQPFPLQSESIFALPPSFVTSSVIEQPQPSQTTPIEYPPPFTPSQETNIIQSPLASPGTSSPMNYFSVSPSPSPFVPRTLSQGKKHIMTSKYMYVVPKRFRM